MNESFFQPLNLKKWIEENRSQLKPPVGNKLIWEDRKFMAFIVGGPNQRLDYHINEGEEFYYQIEGDITVRVMVGGKPKEVVIKEGEVYLLPAKVPHSPQRGAGTVGLVIEHKRQPEQKDGVRWYCKECNHPLHEEFFTLKSIVKDLPPIFERFYADPAKGKCSKCGAVLKKPA